MDQSSRKSPPDFFVLAPPRSGSTWCWKKLSLHPEVFLPATKELKYFSNYHDSCDDAWYLNQFAEGRQLVTGDVSPSYTILTDRLIRKVYEMAPDLQLLFLFREPVVRAWSHLQHQYRLKESVFAFEDRPFDPLAVERHMDWAVQSVVQPYLDYCSMVKRWLRFYPKDNFHFHFFDDIVSNPECLLGEMFSQIGVSVEMDWESMNLTEHVNSGWGLFIPESFEAFLQARFAPMLNAFSALLRDEFSIEIPEYWMSARSDSLLYPVDDRLVSFNLCCGDEQGVLASALKMETVLSRYHEVLSEDYKGYRVVAYRGCVWGFPKVINDFNIDLADQPALEIMRAEGVLLCSETLAGLRVLIEECLQNSAPTRLAESSIPLPVVNAMLLEKDRSTIELRADWEARGDRIRDLEEELVKQRVSSAGLNEDLTALTADWEARGNLIKSLEDEVRKRDAASARLTEDLVALTADLEARGDRIRELEDELVKQGVASAGLNKDLVALTADLEARGDRIRELEDELVKQGVASAGLNKDLVALTADWEARGDRIRELEGELERGSGLTRS
ncbi:sulfotransferase domain-containing protein [Maridesulfovibrio zosterae]|uniref:sulfotransferase domain-containing protein n=1 Tax=Maridesulfovibrio zosterae TaxID=82171 RepID=UPI0003F4F51D|nr:sulfotransferase domain-containing protein [Maridesulfovibrio zosterae]